MKNLIRNIETAWSSVADDLMEFVVLKKIAALLFGHKYYANIINTRGTCKAELCCYIFVSKAEADRHRKDLDFNRSFSFVERVSFRSRVVYKSTYNEPRLQH